MLIKKLLIIIPILFFISCDEANEPAPYQENTIIFSHSFGEEEFEINQTIHTNDSGNNLQFSQLKYYVSQVQFVGDNGQTETVSSYDFIDLQEGNTNLTFSTPEFSEISAVKFLVGVDSAANYSDPASHGPSSVLNPARNDMYWNWMSGYIYISMEGILKNEANETFSGFSYHVGKSENLMEINIPTNLDLDISNQIQINFDLKMIFDSAHIIDIQNLTVTHSTNDNGLSSKLSDNIKNSFSIVVE